MNAQHGGSGNVRKWDYNRSRHLVGLAKLSHGQSGGFSLTNFGINIGSTNTQTSSVGNVTPAVAKSSKPAWIGLAIAAIGFFTALIGFFKG
jgi:hypothetical protein